jgi:5-methylcytosine-specific restriction enzyme subunit McrC
MQESEPEKCRHSFQLLKEHLRRAWKTRPKSDFFRDTDNGGEFVGYVDFDDVGFRLRAHNYVGYISLGDIELTILPKYLMPQGSDAVNDYETERMGFKELMYLLRYAYNVPSTYKEISSIGYDIKQEILEFFIYVFSSEADEKLKRHQYRRYENISENLPIIKGKIMFAEHVKQNVVKSRMDRMYCSFDTYTEDNAFNRFVKYVCKKLMARTKVEINKRNLRNILNLLIDVSDEIISKSEASRIVLTRLEGDLEPILNWCKIFLNEGLLNPKGNKSDVNSILLNMDRVFEGFICKFLQKNFIEYKFQPQFSRDYLAMTGSGESVFRMSYDILGILKNREIIIDTKNKRTNFSSPDLKGGVSQHDLYQMSSYAMRRKCKNVILIYPKSIGDSGADAVQYFIKDEFDESGVPIKVSCEQIEVSLPESESSGEKDERLVHRFNKIFQDC